MTINTAINPLHEALDAAAPNQEMWLAGEAAYEQVSNTPGTTKADAYRAALDAAAPDGGSWLAGEQKLIDRGELPRPTPRSAVRRGWDKVTEKISGKKRHEDDGTPSEPTWLSYLGFTLLGAFLGFLAGALFGFVWNIITISALNTDAVYQNTVLTICMVAGTLAGAAFGFAWAAARHRKFRKIHGIVVVEEHDGIDAIVVERHHTPQTA